MKTKTKINPDYKSKGKSTLLVPAYLYNDLMDLIDYHKGAKYLLENLLDKYLLKSQRICFSKNRLSVIKYQENDLGLQIVTFRPMEKDWIRIKLLASSLGLSICAFFVFLLQLELAGGLGSELKFGIVPPFFKKFSILKSITLSNIPEYTQITHFKT